MIEDELDMAFLNVKPVKDSTRNGEASWGDCSYSHVMFRY